MAAGEQRAADESLHRGYNPKDAGDDKVALAGRAAALVDCRPGTHVIRLQCVVTANAGLESDDVDTLEEGTLVNVLEVVDCPTVCRVRGRIESPNGWISLVNTELDGRWAVLVDVEDAEVRRALQNVAWSVDFQALGRVLRRSHRALFAVLKAAIEVWRSPLSLFDDRAEAVALDSGVPAWSVTCVAHARELTDRASELHDLADVYGAQIHVADRDGKGIHRESMRRQLDKLDALSQSLRDHVPLLLAARVAFDRPAEAPQVAPEAVASFLDSLARRESSPLGVGDTPAISDARVTILQQGATVQSTMRGLSHTLSSLGRAGVAFLNAMPAGAKKAEQVEEAVQGGQLVEEEQRTETAEAVEAVEPLKPVDQVDQVEQVSHAEQVQRVMHLEQLGVVGALEQSEQAGQAESAKQVVTDVLGVDDCALYVRRVRVRAGALVDSIGFEYSDGSEQACSWGLGGREHQPFVLEDDEFLVMVRGRQGPCLGQVRFVTNRGRESAIYGEAEGGTAFVLRASPLAQVARPDCNHVER